MFNPYVLLAVGAFWLISVGSAYVTGSRHATNAAKAAQGEALTKAVAAAHAQGVQDMQIEAGNEETRQAVRIEYRDRVNAVERIVREKPSACRVSDDVLGVLNAAIESANTAVAAKPKPVPAATEASVQP